MRPVAPALDGYDSTEGRRPKSRTPHVVSTGVRPMIEKCPLAKANEAYARMVSGKAEFRVVLTM